ncbi:DUF5979 domain-containing protein [Agromyces cerinus]|uniref:Uncharacterized protein n=1 Tax=Agromyces cerinus subsp. cerinus TaxID=232089 RepID=A0A1N6H9K6_9MICO|nr:DUF5979 domain-containing protein [Agromyces cerinus]SIO16484.1 hypothetical protein SAMN05443544_3007 [Agromyces cerinus subsp. cerinus]
MHPIAHTPTRTPRGFRAIAATVATALASFAMIVAMPTAAQATELDAITSVSIDADAPIGVRQRYAVEATWAAPAGAVEGDTFRLDFPSPVHAYSADFVLRDSAGATVGDCVVTESSIVCTLGDYVETHDDVQGSLHFFARSSEATDDDAYVFTTGTGIEIRVPIPGGGIVEGDGEPGTAPTSPQKWGWLNDDGTSITWQVVIPAAVLAGDTPVVLDDVYDARMGFDPSSLTAGWVLASEWAAWKVHDVVAGTGPETYTLVDSPATHSFELTFNEPVTTADRDYVLRYRTTLPADARQGDLFGNTITASGEQFTTWPVEFVTAGGEGGGTGRIGGFTVTKTLSGDGAAVVPDGTVYAVTYAYLRGDEPVTGTLELSPGVPQGIDGLPTGTVVTLGEAVPEAISGVDYGTPRFSGDGIVADGGSARLVIGDRTTVSVSLDNPVALVPPTPSTPPTPPGSSTPPASTPASPATGGSLASTGIELGRPIAGAALLALLGAAALVAARRRAQTR